MYCVPVEPAMFPCPGLRTCLVITCDLIKNCPKHDYKPRVFFMEKINIHRALASTLNK